MLMMEKKAAPKKNKASEKKRGAESFAPLGDVLSALDALELSLGYEARPADEFKQAEPLDGLILILLSQNTNDRNRDIAFANLKRHYPKWEQVAALEAEEIASLIRVAGLGNTKSERMKLILEHIRTEFGVYSIDAMLDWDPKRAREFLGALPGVGPKTVACVLVFDLGMPAFPVDTHVDRLSHKLGWVPGRMSPEKTQSYLEGILPPDRFRGAHLNLIEHGRRICHARKPACADCCIRALCHWTREQAEAQQS